MFLHVRNSYEIHGSLQKVSGSSGKFPGVSGNLPGPFFQLPGTGELLLGLVQRCLGWTVQGTCSFASRCGVGTRPYDSALYGRKYRPPSPEVPSELPEESSEILEDSSEISGASHGSKRSSKVVPWISSGTQNTTCFKVPEKSHGTTL